ncbi:MAG: FAD-binding oxidoreductase [Candidatus Lokiarchaeota archaeon]|nr:FAD-binding oxidoreductase [Candidatus Lokiarchaeota archaeon]
MSASYDVAAAKAVLAGIVGVTNVSTEPLVLCSYAEDASPFEGKLPGIVVRPQSTAEVQAIMAFAAKHKVPVVPAGGRSSICGSTIPRIDNAIMIDFTRMDQVITLDEDAMTVTVQPGITWSRLIHDLKEKGYKLGFRGPYGGNAGTVAGALSANSIGCGASAHGGAPDSVVGLEVVLASGEVIKTGSGWKEKAGPNDVFARFCTYNDITGLFLGDHGTLGLKTAATLKIFPIPRGTAYFDMGFPDIHSGTRAFQEIQKEHLAEEIVMLGDDNSIELLVSSYQSTFPDVHCLFGVIIEETDERIADIKKETCEKIARKHGGKPIGQFLAKAHWNNMFNLTQSLFEEGFWHNTCHLRKISTLPGIIEQFHAIAKKHDLKANEINWIISALGVAHCYTSGWITLFLKDKSKQRILDAAWGELKASEIASGGVPYWTGKLWEPYVLPITNKAFLDVVERVKEALDPDNLIHPQVFRG